MEKVLHFEEIPNDFRFQKLDSDNNSTSYKTTDNKCYKEYHDTGIDDEVTRMLLDLRSESFMFPQQLVYLNEKFKGYLKKLIDGKSLEKIDDAVSVRKFIKALYEFETDLINFSNNTGLNVGYINLHDLLYNFDQNRIILNNTDSIGEEKYYTGSISCENMKELSNTLVRPFLSCSYDSDRLSK